MPLSVHVHVCAFGHVCVCVYCVRNNREGRALEGGKKTGDWNTCEKRAAGLREKKERDSKRKEGMRERSGKVDKEEQNMHEMPP